MRVTARRLRREDGIATVLVSITLLVVFASAMLAVDAGSLWVSRRTLTTGTDASALAAARSYALGGDGCGVAAGALTANADGSRVDACTRSALGPLGGHVTVRATSAPVQLRFGPALGLGDQTVEASSSAMWGQISQARGLRPIGICVADPHVRWWLGLGADAGVHPAPGVHRIFYTKEHPDSCGGKAAGNWGFMDFDGGSNSASDLKRWIEFGYGAPVGIHDCNADGTAGDPCNGDTGSGASSIEDALRTLADTAEAFGIVIFDTVRAQGSNVEYGIFQFVGVILRGFRVTGPEQQRYFDFEFTRIVLDGNCCTPTPPDTGVRGIRICDYDGDVVPTDVRCTTV